MSDEGDSLAWIFKTQPSTSRDSEQDIDNSLVFSPSQVPSVAPSQDSEDTQPPTETQMLDLQDDNSTDLFEEPTPSPSHAVVLISSESEDDVSDSIIIKKRKLKSKSPILEVEKQILTNTLSVTTQTVCSGDFITNSTGILAIDLVESFGLTKSTQTLSTGTILSFSRDLFLQ